MSRTQQGATNWYKQDTVTEDTRMGIIPLSFKFDGIGASGYADLTGMAVDFQEAGVLVEQELAEWRVRASVDSGSSWDVQLWDASASVELAVLNFTETSDTNKSVAFSLPSSGKTVLVRFRKNSGSEQKELHLKSACIVWRATP